MRILITGGAGFLGYHLAMELVRRGGDVTLVDSLARGRRDRPLENLIRSDRVEFREMDLLDAGALATLGSRFDEVYHLAAVVGVRHVNADPARVLRTNVRTLFNILDYVRSGNHGRLFFASTSEVYAWTQKFHPIPVPTPEDVPLSVDSVENGRATYAASKFVGEMAVTHSLQDRSGSFICGRFHNVYGPRMGSAHVIPELFIRMTQGERPMVIREARATRAFCYVDDAVDAMIHLMRSAENGVFNIGNSAEELSIGTLAERIAGAAGYPVDDLRLDLSGQPAILRRCPDTTRLTATGFQPSISLQEGLEKTLAWYADHPTPRGL